MIELPWPYKDLHPNENAHFMAKARAVKKYRRDCALLAGSHKRMTEFSIHFHPPCNRSKRNIDNVIAAFKAGQDGLQDAWGIDDSLFLVEYPKFFEPAVKGGKVVIRQGGSHADTP